MTATIHTIFNAGMLREVARPAVAALSTDELLIARALIDDELARRDDAGPDVAALPILGSRAVALGLQNAVQVLGLILKDRFDRLGRRLEVQVDHRRDVTVFVDDVAVCTHRDVLVCLAAADDAITVSLPRAQPHHAAAAE